MRISLLLALGACFVPFDSVVGMQTSVSQSLPEQARSSDLETIGNFFVPERPTVDMIRGAVVEYFRRTMESTPHFAEVGRLCPAYRQHILDVVGMDAQQATAAAIHGVKQDVIAYWSARLSDSDARAVAGLMGDPSVTRTANGRVTVQPGETATTALQRTYAGTEGDVERFQRLQAEFASTETGRRLIPQISAYQNTLQTRLNQTASTILQGIMQRARTASTAFINRNCPGRHSR